MFIPCARRTLKGEVGDGDGVDVDLQHRACCGDYRLMLHGVNERLEERDLLNALEEGGRRREEEGKGGRGRGIGGSTREKEVRKKYRIVHIVYSVPPCEGIGGVRSQCEEYARVCFTRMLLH